MIAAFEFKYSQHNETIRRAESNARLSAALEAERSPRPGTQPNRRLASLLRRIAGTPVGA